MVGVQLLRIGDLPQHHVPQIIIVSNKIVLLTLWLMHSEYKGNHNGNRKSNLALTLVIRAMHVELLQNGTQLNDLQFQWLYNRRALLATTTVTILLMSLQGMQ